MSPAWASPQPRGTLSTSLGLPPAWDSGIVWTVTLNVITTLSWRMSQPSTQVSCVTLKGRAVGTQGPISNISSLRSGSEAYPLSGAVGGDPCTGPRAQVSSGRSPKPLASRSKPTSVRRRRRPSVRRRCPSVRRRPSSTVRRRRPSVSKRNIS